MHDGSIDSLEGVLAHYEAGGRTLTEGPHKGVGRDNPNKSERIRGFSLTPDERADLDCLPAVADRREPAPRPALRESVATVVTTSDRPEPAPRLTAVDALRGAVMVIMALDHTRDFFHAGAMSFSPEDLARTTPILFFTRWITHVCAPVFLFTAGIGAFLRLDRPGATKAQLSRFLLTRGAWLILIELTVMRLAFNFSFEMRYPVLLLVLCALGVSMIALAALIYLPGGYWPSRALPLSSCTTAWTPCRRRSSARSEASGMCSTSRGCLFLAGFLWLPAIRCCRGLP